MNASNSINLGYVVHLEESDEFLVNYIEHEGACTMSWYVSPDRAKVFKNRKNAQKFIKKHKPEAVCCELYDSGDRFIVNVL